MLTDQIPVKDERGKRVLDDEGNKVYRSVQLGNPKVFSAVVFNAEQIDGLPPLEIKAPDWDRHERAEALLNTSGANISHDRPDRAFCRWSATNSALAATPASTPPTSRGGSRSSG